MAAQKSGWEIALHTQLATLGPSQRAIVSESTTPEDIIQIIQNSQKRNKKAKSNRFVNVLNKITGPLQEFQSVVDVLVQSSAETGYFLLHVAII